MGVVIDKQAQPFCFQTNKKQLSISTLTQKATLSNGSIIVELEDATLALFFSKRLSSRPEKKLVQQWVKTPSQHCCLVLRHQSLTSSFICNAQLDFKALVEYGDYSLTQILEKKSPRHGQSSTQYNWEEGGIRNLQLVKFLIQVTQERRKIAGQWITYHTNQIIYFRKLRKFKLLFLPDIEQMSERERFFDPNNTSMVKQTESQTVFSIGMVLLSLLLKQECSDCYNFHNLSFCWSAFEEKKERLEGLKGNFLSSSEASVDHAQFNIDEELAVLTLAAISSKQQRPSFSEFKQNFFRLLRKISAPFDSDLERSTKRYDTFRSSKVRRSMTIKRTVSRKPGEGHDQNANYSNQNFEFESISLAMKGKCRSVKTPVHMKNQPHSIYEDASDQQLRERYIQKNDI